MVSSHSWACLNSINFPHWRKSFLSERERFDLLLLGSSWDESVNPYYSTYLHDISNFYRCNQNNLAHWSWISLTISHSELSGVTHTVTLLLFIDKSFYLDQDHTVAAYELWILEPFIGLVAEYLFSNRKEFLSESLHKYPALIFLGAKATISMRPGWGKMSIMFRMYN